ncbi:MAG: enoyl-CoA hydratase/isomerase family protein [Phenylobacterium sp.]
MTAPDGGWRIIALAGGALRIGVHRAGPRPERSGEAEILLTVDADPPTPWVAVEAADMDAQVAALAEAAAARPIAAAVLVQVLRMSLVLPFEDALVAESLAYSTLLAGAEFAAWRTATPVRAKPQGPPADMPWLRLARTEAGLMVTLARSEARNAVNARLRDELVEALDFALIDPEAGPVILAGEGPAFSAGGDLNEFGQARDLALAHAVRVQQSPARMVRRLGGRMTVRLHGPCIGAGIEIPAAAARVVATPDAWFRLPEVSMGLIPGAGGTATIPRRIGRERTCFMALSGKAIDAATALAWGLVDEVEAAA